MAHHCNPLLFDTPLHGWRILFWSDIFGSAFFCLVSSLFCIRDCNWMVPLLSHRVRCRGISPESIMDQVDSTPRHHRIGRSRTPCSSPYHLVSSHMSRILIISLLLLSSCSILPGTQEEIQSNARLYSGSGFSIQVPTLWQANTGSVLPSPRSGSLELALVSPEVRYGFSNNLIIMRDTLNGIITSSRYAELSSIQSSKNYLEYTRLLDEPIIFPDSDSSRISVFEAKYNPSTPRLKFIQTAKVCGTIIYLIHFSIPLEKAADAYIALAKTFSCK